MKIQLGKHFYIGVGIGMIANMLVGHSMGIVIISAGMVLLLGGLFSRFVLSSGVKND